MKRISGYCFLLIFLSCKVQPDSNAENDKFDPEKVYKLQLNPATGSVYNYEISNETDLSVAVEGQDVNNINKANVGINYAISKDSSGDFLFTMQFDKIHFYSKSKENEKEMDAANGSFSADPIERMLGVLKEGTIVATVNSAGQTKNIAGYKELGERMMANVVAEDVQTRILMQNQWDRQIGGNLIRKNMEQLFNIFPDSAIHLGDTWKLMSKQESDLNLAVKSIYKLKAINKDIAVIESVGSISSEKPSEVLAALGNAVVNDMKGEQHGEFEMETKTGMLISCRISSDVEGKIMVMGKEIPVKIKSSVKVNGRKKT